MTLTEIQKTATIIALSEFPELIPPLYIMPNHIREKAKKLNLSAEQLLFDCDPYLGRLWYVTSDIKSAKTKLNWITSYHKKLHDYRYLRPYKLNELYTQVELGYIPNSAVEQIFEQLDGREIGEIAYEMGLYDQKDIRSIAIQAIKENPEAVKDYKNGNKKAIGAILAKIKTQGVTDMKTASQLVIELCN